MLKNIGAARTTAKAQNGPITTIKRWTLMSEPSPYTMPELVTIEVMWAMTTPAKPHATPSSGM
jgi:hypothetical protein